jgi:hypothetical protein
MQLCGWSRRSVGSGLTPKRDIYWPMLQAASSRGSMALLHNCTKREHPSGWKQFMPQNILG